MTESTVFATMLDAHREARVGLGLHTIADDSAIDQDGNQYLLVDLSGAPADRWTPGPLMWVCAD